MGKFLFLAMAILIQQHTAVPKERVHDYFQAKESAVADEDRGEMDIKRDIVLFLGFEGSAERYFVLKLANHFIKALWVGRNHGRVLLAGGSCESNFGNTTYKIYLEKNSTFDGSRTKSDLLESVGKVMSIGSKEDKSRGNRLPIELNATTIKRMLTRMFNSSNNRDRLIFGIATEVLTNSFKTVVSSAYEFAEESRNASVGTQLAVFCHTTSNSTAKKLSGLAEKNVTWSSGRIDIDLEIINEMMRRFADEDDRSETLSTFFVFGAGFAVGFMFVVWVVLGTPSFDRRVDYEDDRVDDENEPTRRRLLPWVPKGLHRRRSSKTASDQNRHLLPHPIDDDKKIKKN